MNFTERYVVITGASTGIGRATVNKIIALGGKVTLIARRPELLAAAQRELGKHAMTVSADVGDQTQFIAALDMAVMQSGPIDGLFLNAASLGSFAPTSEYTDESMEATLQVNVKAPFWAIRHDCRR